ncbi:extracellular solute-binding protein [Halosimplex litoreum]|uniref:Extracellular solute-binding protein n=2 Tax=Halosimplex litoreum TaxID=1198301 RepID=A0A7T3FVW7_9EURY|nr:extracellular solute-binding protein [Halosimplex litoreum]
MTDESSTSGRSIDRRRFIRAVGATGVAGGLAGCSGNGDGGDGGSGDGSTGTSTSGGGGSSGGTTVEMIAHDEWANVQQEVNDLLHKYGMSEDITIEMNTVGQTTDDQQSQYRQWLSAGRTTPDIMIFDSGWTIPFLVRDQLLNLEEALPQDLLDRVHNDYFQASVNSATGPNGDLYAFPIYPDFPTIQYRKDLVQDAGYDWEQYATDPMTWEQFSAELKDVYQQSDVEYGFNTQHIAAEQLSCCVFNEYLTTYGGAFFGNPEENLYQNIGERPVTVDEEPVIKSLEMARTLVHGNDASHTLDNIAGNISPEAVAQWDVEGARAPFTSGNAVALRNWPYSIAISGSEDNLGETQGVMPMPYGVPEGEGNYPGTGGSTAALGGWHVGVNPNSEKVDSVVSMLQAMQKPGFMKENFGLTGWMPPVQEVLADSTDVPIMGRYVDSLAYAGEHSIARPVTVLWPQEADAIEQSANSALQSGGNPTEEMNQLADRLTAIENNFEG